MIQRRRHHTQNIRFCFCTREPNPNHKYFAHYTSRLHRQNISRTSRPNREQQQPLAGPTPYKGRSKTSARETEPQTGFSQHGCMEQDPLIKPKNTPKYTKAHLPPPHAHTQVIIKATPMSATGRKGHRLLFLHSAPTL